MRMQKLRACILNEKKNYLGLVEYVSSKDPREGTSEN